MSYENKQTNKKVFLRIKGEKKYKNIQYIVWIKYLHMGFFFQN